MRTAEAKPSPPLLADLGALALCSVIWGTTWRAIKLQLGVVPPLDSVVYRFALASALLFAFSLASGRSLRLSRRQHLEVAAQGATTFAVQYALVYVAEQTTPSGAVAVIFAAIPFVNLLLFRLLAARRAAPQAWIATLLGLAGVAAMSLSQSGQAAARAGVLFALAGVVMAALGNLFAFRAQNAGVATVPGTAWAMGYGAGMLALFQLVTGAPWRFEPDLRYVGFRIPDEFVVGYGLDVGERYRNLRGVHRYKGAEQ